MPKAKKLNLLNDTREQTGEQIREAYMMEDIADTFRHESNVWGFTPDKKIQSNKEKLRLSRVGIFWVPAEQENLKDPANEKSGFLIQQKKNRGF